MRYCTSLWGALLMLLSVGLTAQSLHPRDLVKSARAETSFEDRANLLVPRKSQGGVKSLDEVGADYAVFDLDAGAMEKLRTNAPDNLQMVLRLKDRKMDLELVQVYPFAEGFRITTDNGQTDVKSDLGVHYRGVIVGDEHSVVALSVFDDEVSGLLAIDEGNLVLGKLKKGSGHVLYNDKDLPNPDQGTCDTPNRQIGYTREDLMDQTGIGGRDANNCVNLYLEVDYSIFTQRGSMQNTTNFMTGLFNEVATLYAAEQLNLVLSQLEINSSQDAYNSSGSSGNLTAFRNARQNYNGDLAALVSFQASGGIAYVNAHCSSFGYSFSSISNGYNNVPTYSWSVNVLAHELGHNFGSSHTQACVWNGNNTALDGCVSPEGGCGRPGSPGGGGTIMSYCHLTSVGINLNNGFGPQPGNVMRNRTYNANCLVACSGGGGGNGGGDDDGGGNGGGGNGGGDDDGGGNGGGDADCLDVEISVRTDNYPAETRWELTNASGQVITTGGNYTSRNATYRKLGCLSEGCYTFRIVDSYGDGICCSYGQGNYKITVDGQVVASGSNFQSVETKEICIDTGGDGGSSGGGGGGDDDACATINFGNNSPITYGGNQDKGTVTVNGGNTIILQGNSWKAINYEYSVTSNTVIEFEYGSTSEPEVGGIGFDNNNSISSGFSFKLHGTQNWARREFDNYGGNEGVWKAYRIPVGDFFTGDFSKITFLNDDDDTQDGNSYFRNLRIYEGNACASSPSAAVERVDAIPSAEAATIATQMTLFPNPTGGELNVRFDALPETGHYQLEVYNLRGRRMMSRSVDAADLAAAFRMDVSGLPHGTYLLRATGETVVSQKFTLMR